MRRFSNFNSFRRLTWKQSLINLGNFRSISLLSCESLSSEGLKIKVFTKFVKGYQLLLDSQRDSRELFKIFCYGFQVPKLESKFPEIRSKFFPVRKSNFWIGVRSTTTNTFETLFLTLAFSRTGEAWNVINAVHTELHVLLYSREFLFFGSLKKLPATNFLLLLSHFSYNFFFDVLLLTQHRCLFLLSSKHPLFAFKSPMLDVQSSMHPGLDRWGGRVLSSSVTKSCQKVVKMGNSWN